MPATKPLLSPVMLEATRLTRAGRLNEATAALQRLFRSETPRPAPAAANAATGASHNPPGRPGGQQPLRVFDVELETGRTTPADATPPTGRAGAATQPTAPIGGMVAGRVPEALRGFMERLNHRGADSSHGSLAGQFAAHVPAPLPAGARFMTATFSSDAGSRAYKLYIPSRYRGEAAPLVVMLHGCTQSPDDFAAGTRMNSLAEEHLVLVAYPAQPASANAQKCWNWFSPGDQQRDRGEPALIAGITRQVMRDYAIDPARVYVAGLSAGGAAASIMGTAYPELYAAVGVHSGLACGAASDVSSAFTAMRQGMVGPQHRSATVPSAENPTLVVPTIVFHADRDTTVHPRNGDQVIAQAGATAGGNLAAVTERGHVQGGRAYSRTLYTGADGKVVLEQWVVHGGGHAWSGGSAAGSFTDPKGPDASREMLRFFLDHGRLPLV
jgi:poly(hydroxyalkanoate) depolymerase family esterase